MKQEFREDYVRNATWLSRNQDFDGAALRALEEDATAGRTCQGYRRRSSACSRCSCRRPAGDPTGILGCGLIAWRGPDPGYFEGSPSVRKLAKRWASRIAALANYKGYYSRCWVRNRASATRGTGVRRGSRRIGRKSKSKLKRNVPHFEKRACLRRRERVGQAIGGVAPFTNENAREPAENERDNPENTAGRQRKESFNPPRWSGGVASALNSRMKRKRKKKRAEFRQKSGPWVIAL